jgi:nickel/cobalt exporter
MMAAFIVAIRGTIGQAVLLGLTATVSHTLIVWGIALGGMYLWRGIDAEAMEPYFQLASAVIIIAIALWMFLRTLREQRLQHAGSHGHHHGHDHDHGHHHHHGHTHEEPRGLDVSSGEYQDAHELAHANDIRRRFADRNVTNWQIALFGLTGGLIPCPAAITVLLLCLQLKEFSLGAVLVLCFSIGLAITLVSVGVAAAWSAKHVTKRYGWFSTAARRAPYLSSLLIIAVGVYVGIHGWLGIRAMA